MGLEKLIAKSEKTCPAGYAVYIEYGKDGKPVAKYYQKIEKAGAKMKEYTYNEIKKIEKNVNSFFKMAANAWVNANNSGRNTPDKRIDNLHDKAEKILEPFGVSCDYPGLYPSFKYKGYVFHCVESLFNEIFKIELR